MIERRDFHPATQTVESRYITEEEAIADMVSVLESTHDETSPEGLLQALHDLICSPVQDPADVPALQQIAARWKTLSEEFYVAYARTHRQQQTAHEGAGDGRPGV